jgi:protein-disulfide isomerase/uncharacterized membrane protein
VPYYLQILCALAGIGASTYLLIEHTRLKNGIQDGDSFCSVGTWANCAVVNGSAYSELGGIPLATLGYLYFCALLMVTLAVRPGGKGFGRAQLLAARLALLALLVDAGLGFVQVAILHSICLVCSSTYLASLLYLAFNIAMSGSEKMGFGAKIASALRKRDSSRIPTQSAILGGLGWLVLAAVAMILPGTVVSKTAGVESGDSTQALLDFWVKQPRQEFPVKAGDGTLGNSGAKVHLVEFSDFECPFCQRASGEIHRALDPIKDHVYFVFKNFPLDNACNPVLKQPMHPNSCKLAQLAFCARQKDLFWQFHDAVFGMDEKELEGDINRLQPKLEKILSPAEFKACLESTSAKDNVRQDIDLGIKLDVRATPTLYIDGKKVPLPLTMENIQNMISLEEKAIH